MNWKPIRIKGSTEVASAAVDEHGNLDLSDPWTTVVLPSQRMLQIPTEQIKKDSDGTLTLPFSLEDLGLDQPLSLGSHVIPVMQEELEIGKESVVTATVSVETSTAEQIHRISEELLKESVHVERRPMNQEVAGPLPTREEGTTTIIPLVEEVLVIQRRYVLREEVRITRLQEAVPVEKEITLRTQSAEVKKT